MRKFKTQISTETGGRTEVYDITLDVFNEVTKRKKPFIQKHEDKKISRYGICPSCENPVQLIGLLRNSKVNPYGRHTGKDVDGLPKWDYETYQYCPYAEPGVRRKPSRDAEFFVVNKKVVVLYNLLKEEFDTVVYVLEKTLRIRCSAAFWKKSLDCFIYNHAYCYPWLTEFNLPYIFAYWGMHLNDIYGQFFMPGTGAYKALADQTGVNFVENKYYKGYRQLQRSGRNFLDFTIIFNEHYQKAEEGAELTEQMRFCIMSGDVKEIYSETVTFDQTYFQNIMRKKNRMRRQDLLDYAESIMPPLEITEE